jgi:hypothetical protein
LKFHPETEREYCLLDHLDVTKDEILKLLMLYDNLDVDMVTQEVILLRDTISIGDMVDSNMIKFYIFDKTDDSNCGRLLNNSLPENFCEVRMSELDLNTNLGNYDESLIQTLSLYTGILSINIPNVGDNSMIGIFSSSIPDESFKASSVRLNVFRFNFEMLARYSYDYKKLYSVSLLPLFDKQLVGDTVHDRVLHEYLGLKDSYSLESQLFPYFSSFIVCLGTFRELQDYLLLSLDRIYGRYGLEVDGKLLDYGYILERLTAYYLGLAYHDIDKIRLGDILGIARDGRVTTFYDYHYSLEYPLRSWYGIFMRNVYFNPNYKKLRVNSLMGVSQLLKHYRTYDEIGKLDILIMTTNTDVFNLMRVNSVKCFLYEE